MPTPPPMMQPGGFPDPTARSSQPTVPWTRTAEHDDEDPDLIDVLVAEHRVVEQLFAEIETTTDDPRRRRDIVDVVIAELTRHSAAEERYLYPTTREHLSAGEDLAKHELAEHAEAAELISRIKPLDATDPDLDPLITRLMADMRHHVQEEETELFPRLRQACSRESLRRLGTEVLRDGTAPGT